MFAWAVGTEANPVAASRMAIVKDDLFMWLNWALCPVNGALENLRRFFTQNGQSGAGYVPAALSRP